VKADAVFEGGGVKGIAFVGAICCLEECGYQWEKLAGTSAGAIVAALLAVGYRGRELKEIMEKLNYTCFQDKDKLQTLPLIGKPLGLLAHKGLYCGNFIEQWLGDLLKAKGKTKFRDVSVDGKSRLKIIAADVTKKEIMILPDDLERYGINPLEFEIARAVRMSIGIPFYFNPVNLSYKNGRSLVVDGGVLSNFPVWIFDVKGVPRWPTIGFKLCEDKPIKSGEGKTDILSYLLDIIDTVFSRNEEIYLSDKEAVRTICIPTLGVKTTQFNISQEDSLKLYEEGYNRAKEFIRHWNFHEYIKKYRIIKVNVDRDKKLL
jgi:NTE family protein